MEIEKQLSNVVTTEIEELSKVGLGTEEHKQAIDNVAKITDKIIELKKLERDDEHKLDQLKADKKDRLVKNVIGAASVVVPAALTVWGTLTFAKMEYEDGKMLTGFGGKFANLFLPKK